MSSMYKIDLHTHSIASPDGSITPQQFEHLISQNILDCVAITDHNRIELALELRQRLGDRIIVGEEINTTAGEIIGLYLTHIVLPGRTPLETVQAIKEQGGFVYVPHPFETLRRGMAEATLSEIADLIDIIEVHNGRAVFQNRGPQAVAWAKIHHKIRAASSDSHNLKGIGTTYTQVEQLPTPETFLDIIAKGHLITKRPPLRSLLSPKANRLRKKLGWRR